MSIKGNESNTHAKREGQRDRQELLHGEGMKNFLCVKGVSAIFHFFSHELSADLTHPLMPTPLWCKQL